LNDFDPAADTVFADVRRWKYDSLLDVITVGVPIVEVVRWLGGVVKGTSGYPHVYTVSLYPGTIGNAQYANGAIDSAVFAADLHRALARMVDDTTRSVWGDSINARMPIGDTNYSQGSCATGGHIATLYLIDTSGVDDTIPGLGVWVLDNARTSTAAHGTSIGVGYLDVGILGSDTFWVQVVSPGTYIFPVQEIITTAASVDTFDIEGYNVPAGTVPPASHQTTLTGRCLDMESNGLPYCEVSIHLVGATAMYSSTVLYPPGQTVLYADANGDWSATIIGTDSLTAYLPSGSNQVTYCVEYKHPSIQQGGMFRACGLSIPANGGTTQLRDILAQ
jgi:hypothetical protein